MAVGSNSDRLWTLRATGPRDR